MSKKRKIIEIFAIENEDNSITFDFNKVEDTEISDFILKKILTSLSLCKNVDDEIEIEYEGDK